MTDLDFRIIADIGLGGMALALYVKLNALVKLLTTTSKSQGDALQEHGVRLDSHGDRITKLESRW